MSRPQAVFLMLTLLLAAGLGGCSREGPATPAEEIDTSLWMDSLGTASAIPLQECRHLPMEPLRIAAAGAGTYAGCVPPYAKQDDAVPLRRVDNALEF